MPYPDISDSNFWNPSWISHVIINELLCNKFVTPMEQFEFIVLLCYKAIGLYATNDINLFKTSIAVRFLLMGFVYLLGVFLQLNFDGKS